KRILARSIDEYLTRIFHELLSRDHEDGCATWQPSRGTAGLVRDVPERYVAGADTRGRQEGWPYPWSQQVIHEISGLIQLTEGDIMTELSKMVVLPVDGSENALRSLDYLHLLYGSRHNLEVTLKYVLPSLPPILADDRSMKRETAMKLKTLENKNIRLA
ncbi:MAG: hypothetical protein JRE83_04140, partial [Deltaproteobacteria bacterium]|nr:hypothetical protein [Deltaproteobacteria bacterium]